jgi:hypothetical protein
MAGWYSRLSPWASPSRANTSIPSSVWSSSSTGSGRPSPANANSRCWRAGWARSFSGACWPCPSFSSSTPTSGLLRSTACAIPFSITAGTHRARKCSAPTILSGGRWSGCSSRCPGTPACSSSPPLSWLVAHHLYPALGHPRVCRRPGLDADL